MYLLFLSHSSKLPSRVLCKLALNRFACDFLTLNSFPCSYLILNISIVTLVNVSDERPRRVRGTQE